MYSRPGMKIVLPGTGLADVDDDVVRLREKGTPQ
jgi:hypothetical protein